MGTIRKITPLVNFVGWAAERNLTPYLEACTPQPTRYNKSLARTIHLTNYRG